MDIDVELLPAHYTMVLGHRNRWRFTAALFWEASFYLAPNDRDILKFVRVQHWWNGEGLGACRLVGAL